MPANKPAASGSSSNKSTARSAASRQGGRLSADSIGWYLSNIGRVPLLTPAEEIELAHHVQAMKRLQELPAAELTARQKHQIRMGT
ncbi:MAG: RNA polymerase subunit sigma, partial [Synechococcaceae bacterium WB7_3xG_012]|nr:RNA polymerase subunit sigma [Synechococcaceae bacterium WB7_3xG_012]